ncbi:MAG: elongation factor G [Firmicutes bacterium]|nr:elongation factor G [Bacillota bacterium]
MKSYSSDKIRNVALVGHSGTGKTMFVESILNQIGITNRMGKVEDGNTVSDYDKMEIEKGYSINTSMIPIEWKGTKINFIDTPGFFDFAGEVNAALRAAETALILVDGSNPVQVGTEKAWRACEKTNTPRIIVIADKGGADVDAAIDALKSKFGSGITPLAWPLTDIDDDLMEAIASADEELMEKYFEGEEFTDAEIKKGLGGGILDGSIVPVCKTPFALGQPADDILDFIVGIALSPLDAAEPADASAAPSAFVFKTIADPFVGKISVMKVVSGKLTGGMELVNERESKSEKLGKLMSLRGNKQEDMDAAEAGDIVAVAKLQSVQTGDTLCAKGSDISYDPIDFPSPILYQAIEAADKKQEDKVFAGLARLREEDPSFVIERNSETRQTLLGGQGEQQLNIIKDKLKDRFGVEVVTIPQKIAYRETIRGTSDVQGKHKKQTGGAGQYGDVHIKFSPCEAEFEFEETLFGGSIPKNYVPAIEKGLVESLERGPLAGCKVQGIHANLYDGSYHDVDSNEMAFKIAASLAFKKGIVEANPILLEPIMHLDIIVPDDNMGDVMGDMNKRRGRILGSEPLPSGEQKVIAEAPQAELFDYAITIRQMTQGRGSYEMTFERYDQVPGNIAEKIIAQHKAEEEAN